MTDRDHVAKLTAVAIIQSASEEERAVLLTWAQQVIAIRTSGITPVQKLARIAAVTHELGITKSLLRHLLEGAQRVLWTDRGKPMRGVIGGAGIGLIASVGGPMAGVAALGGAVAVPIVLLGAGAGAILVAVVEELGGDKT